MPGRRSVVQAAFLLAALALSVAAQEGGDTAATGDGASSSVEAGGMRVQRNRPVITRPIVRDRVLIYTVPRREGLSEAMLPGGRVGTRQWSGMPEGSAVYDPANGYYYSPSPQTSRIPVTVVLDDGTSYTVYMPYDPSRPMDPAGYSRMLLAARRYAEAAAAAPPPAGDAGVAAAGAPTAPAGPASQPARQGGRFGSRLAPMLGGDPRVSMHFALGEAKLRQGRFGEAIGPFRLSLSAAPNDTASHLGLALAIAGVGNLAPAAEEVKKGLRTVPDPAVLALDPAEVFDDPKVFTRLLSQAADALLESPADADLNVMAGFLEYLAGHYSQAADMLEKSREAGLRDPGVARLLVAARAQLRKQKEAAEAEPAAQPQPAAQAQPAAEPAG